MIQVASQYSFNQYFYHEELRGTIVGRIICWKYIIIYVWTRRDRGRPPVLASTLIAFIIKRVGLLPLAADRQSGQLISEP